MTTSLNTLGIQDLSKRIDNGTASVQEVFDIIEARIHKRVLEKRPLLAPVVAFRNQLAETIGNTLGQPLPKRSVPTYNKANTALPTDPEQLADVVFATVGAAHIGAVIQRLTARVVSA